MDREPWSRAHEAARAAGVELRPLSRLEDGERILGVMVATWGEHQLIPREMLRALGDSASPPFGAFADRELIGYVLGWIARDPEDGLVVHSHMLAALPDRRHRGVGYALKLAQRAQALEAGIDVVRWTFDPLIARNAWLNLSKLGAVADRFHRDYYGPMEDLVNRGERTDRLVVRWDLRRRPADVPLEGAPVLVEAEDDAPAATSTAIPEHGAALIRIPRDHERLRADRPDLARAWRDPVAEAIEACIASGRIARGFTRDSAYVFA